MTRIHPITGAVLVRGMRAIALRFGNQTRVVDVPGWYAVEDLTGEHGLHDAGDMRVSDQALADMKADGISRAADNEPVGGSAMIRPSWALRVARLEAIMAEAMLDPTTADLLGAPVLDSWRIVVSPLGFTALRGDLMENGAWTGAEIYTTPLLRLEQSEGWARTFSALYRLNAPAPDAALPSDEKSKLAIDRNRKLIPTRPWMFEPPDWSRR